MKNLKRTLSMSFLILMFSGLISCEWFTNPDDNPNRPDEKDSARWGDSFWGDSKWN